MKKQPTHRKPKSGAITNPDNFDDDALNAADQHTANYWRLAQSGQAPERHDDPFPDPGDPDHHDGFYGYKWSVDDLDIRRASYQLAALLFGPDDGSIIRDDIECQIQKVMKMSFDYTVERAS